MFGGSARSLPSGKVPERLDSGLTFGHYTKLERLEKRNTLAYFGHSHVGKKKVL